MTLTHALGWTLIHFLWQAAIIAVLLGCILALLRRSTPRLRYAVSCAAMVLMLVCATATFLDFEFVEKSSPATPFHFANDFLNLRFSTPPNGTDALPRTNAVTDYLPLFVWAWFGGVVALSIRSLGGWAVAARFARRRTWPAEEFWAERFTALLRRLHISTPVKLAVSALAQVPAVVGWVRPVVLMPATVFTGLSAEQIEALLAHELAHVRRHDYLVNLLQTATETLFFYHPAVWWVSRTIRNERENCCDDLAVEVCGNPAAYVRALTELEQMRDSTPSLAIAANGGSLLGRVQRLLHLNPSPNSVPSGLLVIIGIAVVCVSVIGVAASGLKERPQVASALLPEAATTQSTNLLETQPGPPAPPALPAPRASAVIPQATSQQAEVSQGSGDWLDQIEAAGFRNLDVNKLIELKIHGIDGGYIRDIRAAGFDPTVDKLLELKIHGIDGAYIRQMRGTGLELTLDKILEFRIHGITVDFVNEQNQAGLGTLSPDKLLELKIHGVTTDLIRQVQSLGYSGVTVDKILEMKIHGVTPDFIREAKNRFKDLSLDQLIQLKTYNILR